MKSALRKKPPVAASIDKAYFTAMVDDASLGEHPGWLYCLNETLENYIVDRLWTSENYNTYVADHESIATLTDDSYVHFWVLVALSENLL